MQDAGIFARESERLDRAVQVGVASGRVVSVAFPTDVPADAEADHEVLDRLFAFLDGDLDALDDVEVALTVPTDHRRVLKAVRAIPPGETVSVERLARLAGLDADDADDRATVEAALRENPVPVLVPDHRVDGPGATPPEVVEVLRSVER